MSSFFIQVQQSLVTHRKTLRLARLLSLDRYAVVGRLVALWSWCLDNALDGALGDDIDADVLADVMGFDVSLGKPAELLEALLTAGFLDLDDTSDPAHPALCIHDWYEHMGQLIERRAEQREASAERMRRMRARNRAAASDTPAAPTPALAPAATPALADVVVAAAGEAEAGSNEGNGYAAVTRNRGVSYAHVTPLEKRRQEKTRETSLTGQGDLSPERESERERANERTGDQATGTRQARALSRASPAPAFSTSTSATPTPASTATPIAPRRVDVVWDACIAAMGSPPSNSVERGKWARGIKALKESLLDGVTEQDHQGITAEMAAEIGVRCLRYRKRFGTSVPLNPMALAGNWSALATDIAPTTSRTTWEGQRHGNFTTRPTGQQRQYAAQAGRSGGRSGRAGGRPAIGTAEYYAQAANNASGSGASNTTRDAGGASREGGASAATLAIG